jgi:hypothetical protein
MALDSSVTTSVGPTGAIALVSWLMLFLFSEVGGRPVAIYLLARCVVNVLSIHADDADNDNADDDDDADDADLAKALLPTLAVFLFVVQ